MTNKLSYKKKRQINKIIQKANIVEISWIKTTNNSLDSSDKNQLLVSIPRIKLSKLNIKYINIALISANVYYLVLCLKEA